MGSGWKSDARRLSQGIGLFYDAIGDESRWPEALGGLMSALQAHACHLFAWDARRRRIAFDLHSGFSPEAITAYNAYYVQISPLRQFGEGAKVGEVFRCHELFDDAFVARSEYYNEYRLPISGTRYAIATVLERTADHMMSLAFHRAAEASPFAEGETEEILLLVPHIVRALRIQSLIERSEALATGLERAVDTFDLAIALLDIEGHVVFANGAMEDLLRLGDGLSAIGGRLATTHPADGPHLKRALKDAAELALGGTSVSPARVVRLTRRGCRQPLALHTVPLRPGSALLSGLAVPRLLVLISDPMRRPVPATEVLRVIFGLSPAEAEVALLLARGLDVQAVAEERGVGTETVRRQLKALFAKTDTRRQADFAALLARMALLPQSR